MATRKIKLKITEEQYKHLTTHLFRSDKGEHAAVILASISKRPKCTYLLTKQIITAQDGVDFVPGTRGHMMLKAEFIHKQIDKCVDEKLVYLAVHNHNGEDYVSFSNVDMASHERGYQALLDIVNGQPVGALVFAKNAVAGDIWMPDGSRHILNSAIIIGNHITTIQNKPRKIKYTFDSKRFDRQSRIFGDRGQQLFSSLHIGIIGCGGVGSILIELLARLSIGEITIIDPEYIEKSNLPRLISSKASDAEPSNSITQFINTIHFLSNIFLTKKVEYASRLAKTANPNIKINKYFNNALEKNIADSLLDCDYIFLAADNNQIRRLFNAIVHQYLIPGAQIGSKISLNKENGNITNIFTANRTLSTYSGCLICNGLINFTKMSEESLDSEDLKAQKYLDDLDVPAPSVMSLNALGVAQAINDFMFMFTGLSVKDKPKYTISFPLEGVYESVTPRKDSNCRDCGNTTNSRFAKGDLLRLPTKQ